MPEATHGAPRGAETFSVYAIENLKSGKRYFGKAKNPEKRWGEHQRHAKRGDGHLIHKAMRKYGVDLFKFSVLHDGLTEAKALELEVFYVEHFEGKSSRCGYNMTDGGEGVSGLKKSAEERRAQSERMMGQPSPRKGAIVTAATRARMSASHVGHVHTEEQKRKIGEAGKGRVFSDERKRKISEACKAAWSKSPARRDAQRIACGKPRLTDATVREIRRLGSEGLLSTGSIAKQFDVTPATVRHVISRATWKHLG